MVKRSLELWHEANEQWDRPLLHVSGVLHMRRADSPINLDGSGLLLSAANVPHEVLDHDELAKRYPQINMRCGLRTHRRLPAGETRLPGGGRCFHE
jgi:hypothetical protein